jgi:hypothetical protein
VRKISLVDRHSRSVLEIEECERKHNSRDHKRSTPSNRANTRVEVSNMEAPPPRRLFIDDRRRRNDCPMDRVVVFFAPQRIGQHAHDLIQPRHLQFRDPPQWLLTLLIRMQEACKRFVGLPDFLHRGGFRERLLLIVGHLFEPRISHPREIRSRVFGKPDCSRMERSANVLDLHHDEYQQRSQQQRRTKSTEACVNTATTPIPHGISIASQKHRTATSAIITPNRIPPSAAHSAQSLCAWLATATGFDDRVARVDP